MPVVEPSNLLSPNHSAVPPQPENETRPESRTHRVSGSRGDGDNQASQPRIKHNDARRSGAVGRGIRHYTDSFSGPDADTDVVQHPIADVDKFPQRRKRRERSSQHETQSYQQDTTTDSNSSFDDSDNEWVARSLKRHRVNNPKPPSAIAARQQTRSDSNMTGSQHVQAPRSQESVNALSAKFAEWLFETADIKSVVMDGVRIYQLCFKQDLYSSVYRHAVLSNPQRPHMFNSPTRRGDSELANTPSGVSPLDGSNQFSPTENKALSLSSTNNKKEWVVEKIVGLRKRGRGMQVQVKWAQCEDLTWHPRKDFLETEALLAFEKQHQQVAP